MKSIARLLTPTVVALCLWTIPPPAHAQPSAVPPSYQNLYRLMQQQLAAFNKTLDASGSTASGPGLWAVAFPDADGNVGPGALKPGYYPPLLTQLQELKALGVGAALVQVGFPMLYEPFLGSRQFSEFKAFYKKVANDIRAAGLKVIVENDVLPSQGNRDHWHTAGFFKSLSWEQYQQARATTAATVAETMKPDYLVVLQEPDTESEHSGQAEVNTPDGATTLVSELIASVAKAGVTGTRVSAGVGSWLHNGEAFIRQFATLPLDTIDIHIYPINRGDLPRALSIAQIAASAGKPVSISESWLNKLLDDEVGNLGSEVARSRNTYAFWAPLDTDFLNMLRNFASHTHMVFANVFDTHYLWAYLNYPKVEHLKPVQLLNKETKASTAANLKGHFTSTGKNFYHMIVQPPNKSAPSVPSDLRGTSPHPKQVQLRWTASRDEVGVVGYYVYRDGVKVKLVILPNYLDNTLSPKHTYAFSVEAFDLAGNVSGRSPEIHVTTK